MLIRLGYDIQFTVVQPVPIASLLSVPPSRRHDRPGPDRDSASGDPEPAASTDTFGNICTRLVTPVGTLRLTNSTTIVDSGEPDPVSPNAREVPVEELPTETLRFLMA